ncbi:extracellular matrix regulator RemB [Halalkalibacter alkalisediminis]|uniref:Extracellular matrix regulator RemB n=1 Tax=Halalkalibacter alkalisediminis TaxID=935616 RepID=A0ABV6NKN2_9BACI|nr:extracellular matrix/biofilm biosynthesis regulator RemA family protein [Halalkalibacter alkalisediminis]
MFIHLGGDVIIRSKEIIAILNWEVQEQSPITGVYLKEEEKRKKKIVISEDYIKSIVLTDDEIYYSPVSSLTLNRRAQGLALLDMNVEIEDEIEP